MFFERAGSTRTLKKHYLFTLTPFILFRYLTITIYFSKKLCCSIDPYRPSVITLMSFPYELNTFP